MKHPTHLLSAAGVVFDADGRVLIGKHPRRGWDFTGGQIENGEDLEAGVLREIFEESGVHASVRCLSGIYSNIRPRPEPDGSPFPTILHFAFICDYINGELRCSEETEQLLWVPQHKVLDYIQVPISRLRYQHILDYGGKVRYCAYAMDPTFAVLSTREL